MPSVDSLTPQKRRYLRNKEKIDAWHAEYKEMVPLIYYKNLQPLWAIYNLIKSKKIS